VVSEAFEGKRQVLRHRMIYDALREEMNNPIHALQLKTKTPSEVG
jgi:BolA protein